MRNLQPILLLTAFSIRPGDAVTQGDTELAVYAGVLAHYATGDSLVLSDTARSFERRWLDTPVLAKDSSLAQLTVAPSPRPLHDTDFTSPGLVLRTIQDSDSRSAAYHEFSRVAFSRDSTHAVVYFAYNCSFCGFGSLYFLRRASNGTWEISEEVNLWIS